MKPSLLLTLDYELYGDGSGDVFKHIVEPTQEILAIAERYNAKITVFFEVVEYWHLKQEWESGNRMGYDRNPIEAMEQQVLDMISRGHDVQLHIHPQWVDARWEDGHWVVDFNNWRLGTFSSPSMTLKQLIAQGKSTLEEMIRPSFPHYECIALRAGGFNAQPSQEIVSAMRELGMRFDSSIVPGGKENGRLSVYDYSGLPIDKGYWYVDDTLEEPSQGRTGVVELLHVAFPIVRLFKFLSVTRIKSILQNRKSAQTSFASKTSTGEKGGGFIKKLSFFFKTEYQTWDYCLFPTWMHGYFLRKVLKQSGRDIFVTIGHPKSFVSPRSMECMLKKTCSRFDYPTISGISNIFFGDKASQ